MQEAEKSSKELENIKELKSPETISEKNLKPQKNKDKEKLHKGYGKSTSVFSDYSDLTKEAAEK